MKLSEHLLKLSSKELLPKNIHIGLCLELESVLFEALKISSMRELCHIMDRLNSEFKYYSGSVKYPIAHDTIDAMEAYHLINNLWVPEEQENEEDRKYVEYRLLYCAMLAEKIRGTKFDCILPTEETSND